MADETAEPEQPEPDQDLIDAFEREINDRLWLRAILPFLQTVKPENAKELSTTKSLERVIEEACCRVVRIMQSDVHQEWRD